MSAKDPLAGMRQAINDHELSSLFWPLKVDGVEQRCPVSVKQVFELRSCTIEITRIERTTRLGEKVWRAAFARFDRKPDRPLLLAPLGSGDSHGYTNDPKRAAGLGEDVFGEAPETIDAVKEEDRTLEHRNAGEPPEPEAVPGHEIKDYRGSRDAHQRFQLELGADRVAEQEAPMEVRLARLRAKSRGRNVDISNDLRVIEKRIENAERKLERSAA